MTTEHPIVDFVMPVFHEEDNIEASLLALTRAASFPHRILVVYDVEDDPTVPVVRALMSKVPNVQLVKNEGRRVLGAIRTGFKSATAEIVIVTMADLSDDLSVIGELVRLIREEGYDVVCPSRYMRGGRQIGGPRVKGFLSRVAGLSLHHLIGFPTADATNAFRAYRRHVLDQIELESQGGFEYTLELTAKAWVRNMRITQVPSTWRDRTGGQSKFDLRRWLPKYLRWYLYALRHRPRDGARAI